MRNIIIVLFLLVLLDSCLPKRVGKVKIINNGTIVRGDSIILLNPFYTYGTFANEITCCDWYKPSERQVEIERQWDSIQSLVVRKYFSTELLKYGNRNSHYNHRPFVFKFLLGSTEKIESDSISFIMTSLSWNIRAGKIQEAYNFLPDSIVKLSYHLPVVVITNDFYFFDIPFRAAYISSSTGLQFSPEVFIVIIKEGKVVYFRGYRKSLYYKKVEKNPDFIGRFTHKLFDKLR
jgi:hypothetical protein